MTAEGVADSEATAIELEAEADKVTLGPSPTTRADDVALLEEDSIPALTVLEAEAASDTLGWGMTSLERLELAGSAGRLVGPATSADEVDVWLGVSTGRLNTPGTSAELVDETDGAGRKVLDGTPFSELELKLKSDGWGARLDGTLRDELSELDAMGTNGATDVGPPNTLLTSVDEAGCASIWREVDEDAAGWPMLTDEVGVACEGTGATSADEEAAGCPRLIDRIGAPWEETWSTPADEEVPDGVRVAVGRLSVDEKV